MVVDAETGALEFYRYEQASGYGCAASSPVIMLLVMLGLQLISCGQDANVNVTKPSLTTAGEESH